MANHLRQAEPGWHAANHLATTDHDNTITKDALAKAVGLMSLLALAVVLLLGAERWGYAQAKASLPDCQEDEYLYPVDYTGPGNNKPSDYRCVHFDNLPNYHP